jgi:hypothetical protein
MLLDELAWEIGCAIGDDGDLLVTRANHNAPSFRLVLQLGEYP